MIDYTAELDSPWAPTSVSAPAPLLAVCGLCGGAGASTLAYLIALDAAKATTTPVLVCDSGGPGGGLATYAGSESNRSLPELANAVAASDDLADGLYADGGDGLRVIASRPQLESSADASGLARALRDAREAHALTVVDCGTLATDASQRVVGAATHVAWVLPATVGGIRRGSAVLGLFGIEAARREIVVARHDATERKAPMAQLTALAAARNAPLVLMPHVPDLAERPAGEALEAAELTLDGLRVVIRR